MEQVEAEKAMRERTPVVAMKGNRPVCGPINSQSGSFFTVQGPDGKKLSPRPASALSPYN